MAPQTPLRYITLERALLTYLQGSRRSKLTSFDLILAVLRPLYGNPLETSTECWRQWTPDELESLQIAIESLIAQRLISGKRSKTYSGEVFYTSLKATKESKQIN